MTKNAALIMGILNATPDSFYDGIKDFSLKTVLQRAEKLISEGADIIDVGGESTRPGATPVPEDEEIRRVIPVVRELRKMTDISLSIDTRKPDVARRALEEGVSLINDVSGMENPQMRRTALHHKADVCVMHMQKTPADMQKNPEYPEGVVPHLKAWFTERIDLLVKEGIPQEKILIDPGIGFGKTVEHNLTILNHISLWKSFGVRVLIGLSRKSFMGKLLVPDLENFQGRVPGKETKDLLPATLAMNTMALFAGADVIRVHDVSEHKDIILMLSHLRKGSS